MSKNKKNKLDGYFPGYHQVIILAIRALPSMRARSKTLDKLADSNREAYFVHSDLDLIPEQLLSGLQSHGKTAFGGFASVGITDIHV